MSAGQDAAQREQALEIDQSFCVQAPAGSGKTELLTQRLLRLLAHVERPEEILAFTFTRKAASEMRERLLHGLRAARERNALPLSERPVLQAHQQRSHELASAVLERDAAANWHLLENPQRLRLTTIDSFTAWLTAQLPLGASLGARATLTTDMAPIFKTAIQNTLHRLDAQDGFGAALRDLLPHLQNDLGKTQQLLLLLLQKREQWLDLALALQQDPGQARDAMENTLRALLDEELGELHTLLAPHTDALLPLLRFASTQLREQPEHELHPLAALADLPPGEADTLPLWQALGRFLLVKSGDGFRRRLTAREGFPAKSAAKDKQQEQTFVAAKEDFAALCATLDDAGMLPALQRLAYLPPARYDENQWHLLSALCTLLPLLAAELNLAMQEAGQVDHTETSLAALRALGSEQQPTDLALRLDYRIRHILVDEFQDTSIIQFLLLERLTAGWENGDGRTLFIVGDGMQSCYAFRNAKVSLFLRARDRGIGTVRLTPLQLQVNFRSDASVVNWVNTVFNQAFPQQDDLRRGGVRYSASVAREEETRSDGVHCCLWVQPAQDRIDSITRRNHEAAEVAQLCRYLQEHEPQRGIAILVRSRTQLRALVPALRAQGLRWNASKIDPLLSYPAINDLFTLLRVLLSFADATAWYALLRSPCIGLALGDLLALAQHGQARQQGIWNSLQEFEAIAGLSPDAQARLARSIPALQRALALRQQRSLRDLLESLWVALGGPACIDDPLLLPNVAEFFALVEEHAAHGDIEDLRLLEDKLARAHGSAVDESVTLQLMTIHNAKGLEFDTVILPALDGITRSGERELLLWHEHLDADNHGQPLLGLLPARGAADDPLYDYLQFEHKQRDTLEATRLLYIAVTRAARSAWLFGYVTATDTGYTCTANSLLHCILPALQRDPAALGVEFIPAPVAPTPPPQESTPRLATQPLLRLPGHWVPPPPAALLPVPPPVPPMEPTHTQPLARTIGDLVHLALKLLVQRRALPPLDTAPWWRQQLAPLCNDTAALQAALATIRTQLDACLHDPMLAWLFAGDLQDDACELALVDYSSGERRDYVVDRTFIDHEGTRWIIDYKSAQPNAGQSTQDFVAGQSATYQEQLRLYARLLRQEGQPLRCALLLTALPALVELPA